MVFATFNWPNLADLQPWLKEKGVIIGAYAGPEIPFVTHYGILKKNVEQLIDFLKEFYAH